MEGKTALGASSPAKPALHIPDPLSTTKPATSSSHIMIDFIKAFDQVGIKSACWQGAVRYGLWVRREGQLDAI